MKPIGNKGLEVGGLMVDNAIRPNKGPEMGLLGDTASARPINSKNLEMGLLGKNNSARAATEGAKNYEQLTLANSVVTWRGGRRGSSLGTCR